MAESIRGQQFGRQMVRQEARGLEGKDGSFYYNMFSQKLTRS
jgi:hypothetical protein